MSIEKHPLHLKVPELQNSPEVNRAVERKEKQIGEKVRNDPSKRIEAYAERLENIFLNPDEETRNRNINLFRNDIYDSLLIKKENFPESYFELQKRVARERGQTIGDIPDAMREQMKEVAIEDQKASLDAWIEYLTSDDAGYPTWFKYFTWKNVTKLSQFDKNRGEFKKRTETTVAPFPDIYREPLARIADMYENYPNVTQTEKQKLADLEKQLKGLTEEEAQKLKEEIKKQKLKVKKIDETFSKKFPSLYAELIQESLAAVLENKEEIRGQWVKYAQGKEGEAEKLFKSIENKGTGWCTAGKSTAEIQMKNGDFYVYYTNDSNGEPTQPRLAIRMEGQERIAEVRGIQPNQNVEPLLQETLDKKLEEFGSEADTYKKKSADMKHLTELEYKYKSNQTFNKEDLIFLYEINSPIEGFGYKDDPRVGQLRKGRNIAQDVLIMYDAKLHEVTPYIGDINEKDKVCMERINSSNLNHLSIEKLNILKSGKIHLFDKDHMKEVKIINTQFKSFDFEEVNWKREQAKNKIYFNSELDKIDWSSINPENVKAIKLNQFVGQGFALNDIGEYVAKKYGDEYIIPDATYREYLMQNPEKIPKSFRHYGSNYLFGSVLVDYHGWLCVPVLHFAPNRDPERYGGWLDGQFKWGKDDTVVIIKKQKQSEKDDINENKINSLKGDIKRLQSSNPKEGSGTGLNIEFNQEPPSEKSGIAARLTKIYKKFFNR